MPCAKREEKKGVFALMNNFENLSILLNDVIPPGRLFGGIIIVYAVMTMEYSCFSLLLSLFVHDRRKLRGKEELKHHLRSLKSCQACILNE